MLSKGGGHHLVREFAIPLRPGSRKRISPVTVVKGSIHVPSRESGGLVNKYKISNTTLLPRMNSFVLCSPILCQRTLTHQPIDPHGTAACAILMFRAGPQSRCTMAPDSGGRRA